MGTIKAEHKDFVLKKLSSAGQQAIWKNLNEEDQNFLFANSDLINGKFEEFFEESRPPEREKLLLVIKSEVNLLIKDKESKKLENISAEPVEEKIQEQHIEPLKEEVVEPKVISREQRALTHAMLAELYRKMNVPGKDYDQVQMNLENHQEKVLLMIKGNIFLAIGASQTSQREINSLSIKYALSPLLGVNNDMPGEIINKEVKHAASLLGIQYQKILIPGSENLSDEQIYTDFKDVVINTTAGKITDFSGEPIKEVKEQLESLYISALEDFSTALFV